MVFILIGAVKAAKQARVEYNKDKKRKAIITPVDGSHDMMADRASSSQPSASAATEWWGTTRLPGAPAPTPDAPPNHEGVGAWSRDHTIQQIADANPDRPPSGYNSSASASTELSAPPQSPSGPNPSTSPLGAVQPLSPGSTELQLPASVTRNDVEHDARSDERYDASLVKRSSRGVDSSTVHARRLSVEMTEELETRKSQKDEPAAVKESLSPNDVRAATPAEQISQVEGIVSGKPKPVKKVVEGSFEAALQRKPNLTKERKQNTNPEGRDETISALARHASKGLRKKPSGTGERIATVARKEAKGSVSGIGLVEETTSCEVVSALARNASKGPRRGLQQPVKAPPTPGSFEANADKDVKGKGVEGSFTATGGAGADLRKCNSAFAGAATKKRVKRRPPPNAQRADLDSRVQSTTSGAAEPAAGPATASTAVVGSSIYTEGSMKKRTSRR